ncbi:MAG: substrate-binding domain-containing protein [Turicibacter sp.]|nr:substrate-binding domain-containing protein [Turicibacter sp.]
MKKLVWASALAASLALVGCHGNAEAGEPAVVEPGGKDIAVVSREEGSGTRSAFEELIGIDEENPVVDGAIVQNATGTVGNSVKDNPEAIGYIAFITLDETKGIRGLKVEGVEPTVDNVLAGDYPLSRPFVMIYDENAVTDADKAFIAYLQSEDGLIEMEAKDGIIDKTGAEPFDADAFGNLEGNLILGGSTSTEKMITHLADTFTALFPHVTYAYDSTGSGAGIKNAQDGTYSIGFASKEVAADEVGEGIAIETFCKDGIAVAVNESNQLEGVTIAQLHDIYTGKITTWDELK